MARSIKKWMMALAMAATVLVGSTTMASAQNEDKTLQLMTSTTTVLAGAPLGTIAPILIALSPMTSTSSSLSMISLAGDLYRHRALAVDNYIQHNEQRVAAGVSLGGGDAILELGALAGIPDEEPFGPLLRAGW